MVDQTKRLKIELIIDYINTNIQISKLLLNREEDLENIFSTTYKGTLDTTIKQKIANIVKILRWLINDLGLSTPNAFTDAQIDAIDPEIRTQI